MILTLANQLETLITTIGGGAILRELPTVEGYSSTRVRQLLNALCSIPDTTYLEIGVHLGSTFIPALYGNEAQATCIDNWSRFGNLRPRFEANLAQHLPGRKINLIESDCFNLDLAQVTQPVNVYFFDGEHTRRDQYEALRYYYPVLAQRFIFLVDDFNWQEPREETYRAIKDLNLKCIKSWELPGDYNGSEKGWWNGLYVGILEK